jgi:hypothetical protein
MRTIVVQVSDQVASKLADEAIRQVTIEELAAERVSSLFGKPSEKRSRARRPRIDYLKLSELGSAAASARKPKEQIDSDIEASRNSW